MDSGAWVSRPWLALGREIQSSFYAIVGDDSTYRYLEAETLGILPPDPSPGVRTAVIRLAGRAEQSPKVSCRIGVTGLKFDVL